MEADRRAQLYELFASLLEYPTPALPEQTGQCIQKLASDHARAAAQMEQFQQAILQLAPEQREELYTGTFDLQPVCYPYLGYQLFGESYKRGAFMARLNEGYRERGYSCGNELPDHISSVLRFLAMDKAGQADVFSQVLLVEGLVPALKKMVGAFDSQSGNPYAALIQALLLVFEAELEKETSHV